MPHFLIRSTELADRRLPLPGKVIVIGRSLDADVPIRHKSVSRRHALLEETDAGFVISDLGSSNGTFVDELRVYPAEKAVLPLGRTFRVGEVKIVLVPDEVIGEEGGVSSVSAQPTARADGSLTLAPTAKATAPDTRQPTPVAAVSPTGGKKPRPALKARIDQRRAKREAMRWAMMGVTVVLLTLAAFFVYRIVDNRKGGPLEIPDGEAAKPGSPDKPEPPPKKPEAAPIIIDEDR